MRVFFAMRKITAIPAIPQLKCPRVAAYCRASSKKEEQLRSLDAQIDYYTKKIRSNPAWEFAGVYSDAQSGRSVIDRPGFLDLMAHCEYGYIDLVLTKSISRMGRNTVDTLEAIRQLSLWNVDVFFETENLHASQSEKQFLLEVWGAFAQAENEERSSNIRWGIAKGLNLGTSKLYSRPCYGYRNENGTLEIIPEEATVVEKIFNLYLDGHSILSIIRELEQQGVESPSGNPRWSKRAIENVLSNEKYAGNVLIGKTFNADFLHPKRQPNKGEAPMYLLKNAHTPIIAQERFDAAQIERTQRSNVEIGEDGKTQRKGTRYSTKKD